MSDIRIFSRAWTRQNHFSAVIFLTDSSIWKQTYTHKWTTLSAKDINSVVKTCVCPSMEKGWPLQLDSTSHMSSDLDQKASSKCSNYSSLLSYLSIHGWAACQETQGLLFFFFSSLYYLFLYHITAFILEYNQPHFIKYRWNERAYFDAFLALCGFIIGYAFLFVLLFRNLRGGCLWLTIVTVNYSMLLNLISSNPRV